MRPLWPSLWRNYERELMTYTITNYKSGKAVREAFTQGTKIEVFQPGGIFPDPKDGIVYLEGPHYPQPHKWYLSAEIKDGIIVRIRKWLRLSFTWLLSSMSWSSLLTCSWDSIGNWAIYNMIIIAKHVLTRTHEWLRLSGGPRSR